MVYPPLPHQERDTDQMFALIRSAPFAHLFSAVGGALQTTQLPFILDNDNGVPNRLRAHMNAQNPQLTELDGAQVLVAFSGPHAYVSPNWRQDKGRGGTWDYSAVHVRGTLRLKNDIAFFVSLIDDLSALMEPRFPDVSDRPNWTSDDAPEGYIEKLFPMLQAFEIAINDVSGVSKFHQDFPAEDATSVSDHLDRVGSGDSKLVADQIRARVKRR